MRLTVVEAEQQNNWNSCSSAELLDEAIRVSGVSPEDRIVIAGNEHLDLLIGLCERGFDNVGCRAPQCGPHLAGEPADLLLLPGVARETQLSAAIEWLGPELRAGGVVLVCCRMLSGQEQSRLRRILMARSYIVEQHSTDAGLFIRAQKQPVRLLQRAA